MRVFIDSDVIVSSLLSQDGAAYILLHSTDITCIVSTDSLKELRVVCKRLHIAGDTLNALIRKKFTVIPLGGIRQKIHSTYRSFVTDPNDAHIMAGAVSASAKYLISYNLKHFKTEKIRNELDILLMTPALFLQYLRSCSSIKL